MKYEGCQKQDGSCDACGIASEYLHTLDSQGRVHLCGMCAEQKVTPRSDQGLPGIAETWSRQGGGKWVSRWHVEEAYR